MSQRFFKESASGVREVIHFVMQYVCRRNSIYFEDSFHILESASHMLFLGLKCFETKDVLKHCNRHAHGKQTRLLLRMLWSTGCACVCMQAH